MNSRVFGLLAVAASAVLATAAFGADPAPASAPAASATTTVTTTTTTTVAAQTEAEKAEADRLAQEAARAAAARPAGTGAGGAPMTQAERLEAGKRAVAQTCANVCHGDDKWQGAARDRENWTRTIDGMFTKIVEFEMPVPPPATYNLILEYMVTTYPQ